MNGNVVKYFILGYHVTLFFFFISCFSATGFFNMRINGKSGFVRIGITQFCDKEKCQKFENRSSMYFYILYKIINK